MKELYTVSIVFTKNETHPNCTKTRTVLFTTMCFAVSKEEAVGIAIKRGSEYNDGFSIHITSARKIANSGATILVEDGKKYRITIEEIT